MSGLSFLHPLLLWGALGAAVPVIIHLVFRRRAGTVMFSAMRFLLLAYRKTARRLLLQEYLLLAARCLMVVFLALAVAAPMCSRPAAGLKSGEGPLAAVFILDTSPSMARKAGKKSLFEQAKQKIFEFLEEAGPADRFALLDACRLEVSELTGDRAAFRRLVEDTTLTSFPARMKQAIALAASRVQDLQAAKPRLIILSDLQKTSWQDPGSLPGDLPPVMAVQPGEGASRNNLAVTEVELGWRALAREEALEVRVAVVNFGSRPAEDVLLRVVSEDQTLGQAVITAQPGAQTRQTLILSEPPHGPGVVALEVDDGMSVDNRRFFLVKGGGKARALLVDGDPGAGFLESETYYLDRALNPRLYARSRVLPRVIPVEGLEQENLDSYQVVVLANVGRLTRETAERLKDFVKKGGGLLITLGDKVDADDYNRALGELLPRELRGVKEPYAGAAGKEEVRLMHLENPSPGPERHPVLSVFADPSQGDLGLASFRKFFLLQHQLGTGSRVILRLTDGAPMMVEKRFGKGKVILFASTIDRDWNDLCIHPVYLPLFQQVALYLAGELFIGQSPEMLLGSIAEIPAGPEVKAAACLTPSGTIRQLEIAASPEGKKVRLTKMERPGVYYIKFKNTAGPVQAFSPEDADRALVLNPDPVESDLTPITRQELRSILGNALELESPQEEKAGPDQKPAMVMTPAAWFFLYGLCLLAALERALTRKG